MYGRICDENLFKSFLKSVDKRPKGQTERTNIKATYHSKSREPLPKHLNIKDHPLPEAKISITSLICVHSTLWSYSINRIKDETSGIIGQSI